MSYGSRVAQHFARRYPASTRTVIIDGVVPPQVALGPEIATESQRAVDTIFARCAGDVACNERFPDLDATFRRVVAALREAPVIVEVADPNSGRPQEIRFGPGELAGAVRLIAYNPNTIALLPLMVHEAGAGNYTPLASQYLLMALSMRDAIALGMHNAVMCTEDVPFLEKDVIDYDAIDATYMGSFQLEALEAMCDIWPAGPIDEDFKEPLSTGIPFLLLSGDADPITPPRYAEMAMKHLVNREHLVGTHQGHGQINVGCTSRLAANFVESADPSSIDDDCLKRSFVMPFFLDFSGPAP